MKRLFLLIVLFFLGLISLFIPSPTFAVWTKYPGNPVVNLGPPGNFDSEEAGAPSILLIGSTYHMWYQGYNSANLNIGHATSNDGINWENRSEINIDKTADPSSVHFHDPSVLYEDGIYKMWFAASPGDFNNIHLDYSTSGDGLNWTAPININLFPSLDWDNYRGISFPSVIKLSDGYEMWFGGNGIISNEEKWQIGHAHSTDGINWEKSINPVVTANILWEGNSVTAPSVIYENGLFEMWYQGDSGIGHATSTDGIIWEKYSNNPIIIPGQDFDFMRILNPFGMKGPNFDKVWYSGQNSDGKWQIGYATNQSETPTPTLTPTLTPTPEVPNPVVLIPGMGASWNQQDMFSCNLSQSGNWAMAPYAAPFYNRLIKTFTQKVGLQQNKDFYVYGYDWRLSMTDAGGKLKTFLDSIPSSKVDIVSHSLGGLVARSYIIENPATNKVDKLITLGTPHGGTVLAYPLWENGEIWSSDLVYKLAINTLLNICRLQVPGFPFNTRRIVVHTLAPSVADILPAYDFIYKNNQLITADLIEGENLWLTNNPFMSPFNSTSFMSVSGDGKNTISTLSVRNAKAADIARGNWLDGNPSSKQFSVSGDGTVLLSSSLVPGSTMKSFSTDHVGLIQNTAPIQEVLNFLGYSTIHPAIQEVTPESRSSFSIAANKPVTLELLTLQNISLQKTDSGIIAEFSDKSSTYKLKMKPSFSGDVILSFSQNGIRDTWKDYKMKVKKGELKNFLLKYNPQKPDQNPLINL